MKDEQTLPRTRRICRSGDYQRLWREGRRYHTTHFVVIVNPGGDQCRLGITASRKVGNAVCRNRLKRWIRELFRFRQARFSQTIDISVVAKHRAGGLSHPQVDRELLSVFTRLETEHHA